VKRSSLPDDVGVDEVARLDLVAGLSRKRREDLRTASDFWRLEASGHFRGEGCASLGEFGERLGFSASETRVLARTGRAVHLYPSLATLVLQGRVTLEAASVLERVLRDPAVQGPHSRSTWVYWAKTESARRLRNRVKARFEAIRTGEAVHERTLHLTDRGQDDLDRSRVILGDRAKRNVVVGAGFSPPGEAIVVRIEGSPRCPASGVAVAPLKAGRQEKPPGHRKVSVLPGGLKPAPTELAHIVAHKDGGGREAKDMFLGCHGHHVEYDAGWFRVEMVDGRPVFHFKNDRVRGPQGGGWPVPPHVRPNPLAGREVRWTWSRPPPG
jgi:hypothetical protein